MFRTNKYGNPSEPNAMTSMYRDQQADGFKLAVSERSNAAPKAFAAEYTGHGANTGGLQRHSIGDTYPLMVVGTMHRCMDERVDYTRYYVLNLVTGEKFYFHSADGEARTWTSCKEAHRVAAAIHKFGASSTEATRYCIIKLK